MFSFSKKGIRNKKKRVREVKLLFVTSPKTPPPLPLLSPLSKFSFKACWIFSFVLLLTSYFCYEAYKNKDFRVSDISFNQFSSKFTCEIARENTLCN